MHNRVAIISDVHLGAISDAHERAFDRFLEAAGGLGDELLIVGDLFDFWFEYRHVVLRGHLGTLARLRRLHEGGMRIRFVGGNHDAWAGEFLRDEVGVEILDAPLVLDLGGRRCRVAHGDAAGGGDWGYRALRRVIRSRLGKAAFRSIHPDLGVPLARLASSTESRGRGPDPAIESPRADRLVAHAGELLDADPALDVVLFGHTHRPELREVRPGRWYLNPGDWVHHRSFAVIGPREIRLETWPLSDGRAPGSASLGIDRGGDDLADGSPEKTGGELSEPGGIVGGEVGPPR